MKILKLVSFGIIVYVYYGDDSYTPEFLLEPVRRIRLTFDKVLTKIENLDI